MVDIQEIDMLEATLGNSLQQYWQKPSTKQLTKCWKKGKIIHYLLQKTKTGKNSYIQETKLQVYNLLKRPEQQETLY